MKRMLVVAALVVTFGTLINACESRGGGTGSSDVRDSTERTNSIQPTDSFPWDFPRDFTLKDVEVGQTVLSPAAFYGGALQRGEDLTATLLPIYCFYIKEVGHNTITVAGMGEEINVPQALVIPLPKDEKAQNGDVLLTWWQSGQGLQRAIVVDDTKPLRPKVCYLDLDYKADGRGFAKNHANEELRPSSFKVLKSGEWMSGASVAVNDNGKWKAAIIVNIKGDKLLLTDAGNRIWAAERANCQLIPFNTNYAVGDMVWAKLGDAFEPDCKVVKVDKRIGRIRVEKHGRMAVLSILEVTKELKKQPKR